MAVHFEVFSNETCPDALYRFRYEVYVEEMGRHQKDADHDAREIRDSLDRAGHQLIAFDGDDIIACVRINLSREGDMGLYHKLYGLGSLTPAEFAKSCMCTRLMVRADFRGGLTPVNIFKKSYEFGLRNDVDICLVDCNDPLLGFFERFGYRRLFERIHPDYGRVSVMRLDIHDLAHLKAVRSPFLGVYRRYPSSPPGQARNA